MQIEWVDKEDEFNTKTSQLCVNKKVLVELVKYDDSPQVYIYTDTEVFFGDVNMYHENMNNAKCAIEDALHNFCIAFNTWYQR